MNRKWDLYFLNLVKEISKASKDPSTQVGALIVNPDKTSVSWGYNGFPRGIEDTEKRLNNRELRIQLTVHAELNAILNTNQPLVGTTLYSLRIPCIECTKAIIQKGITRVVACYDKDYETRWDVSLPKSLFEEAEIELVTYYL